MIHLFAAVYLRDLRLALRRRTEALLPLAFFAIAVTLFPLGVGPEPQTLRLIAPGVLWVCALLSTLLSVQALYALDHADGSLEQLLLADPSALSVALAKAAAHWSVSGLPLVVFGPLFGLMLGLPAGALGVLCATLLLGTPTLSLLGGLGAALTLGLRGGAMLVVLIVLPLTLPTLIFGAGAVDAWSGGLAVGGQLSLLGALCLFSAVAAPWATAAALRIAVE